MGELMLIRKRQLPLLIVLLAAFLSGCSFVRIQNVSASSVTVLVTVPDAGNGYTRSIDSGGIVDVFSSHGGRYTVTVVPSEQYRSILERLRDDISDRLFEEGATLTAEEVGQLVENLNHIDRLLEDLAEPGASCSGRLPDYETAVVVVSYDDFKGEWVLSCQ